MNRINPTLLVDIFGENMPIAAAQYLLSDSAKAASIDTIIADLRRIRNDDRLKTRNDRPLFHELVARAKRIQFDFGLGSTMPAMPTAHAMEAKLLNVLDEMCCAIGAINASLDGYVVGLADGSRVFCEDMIAVDHVRENLQSPVTTIVPILCKGLPRDA